MDARAPRRRGSLRLNGAALPVLLRPCLKACAWPALAPHFPALAHQPVFLFLKNDQPYRHLPDAPRMHRPAPLDPEEAMLMLPGSNPPRWNTCARRGIPGGESIGP